MRNLALFRRDRRITGIALDWQFDISRHHHRQLTTLSATDETAKGEAPKSTDHVDPSIKLKKDEKKIKTSAGSLPMSPLFDPSWRKARRRDKPKPPPDESKWNRFQRRMEENPYAQLLAQPVRSCHVTRVRLPRSFLQDFGVVKHPETNETWWIPGDFRQTPRMDAPQAPEETKETAEMNEPMDENDIPLPAREPTPSDFGVEQAEPGRRSQDSEGTEPAPIAEPTVSQKPYPQQGGRFLAPGHALARQDLLSEFLEKNSTYHFGHMKMGGMMNISFQAQNAAWRVDMHEVIRDHLRGQITSGLLYLSKLCEEKGADYLIPENETKLKLYWFRSCYLWLGEEPREPFGVLDIEGTPGSARPVYDLPRLLGEANVERLKTESPKLLTGPLVLVKRRRTENLINKKLWRLQGFLADYSIAH